MKNGGRPWDARRFFLWGTGVSVEFQDLQIVIGVNANDISGAHNVAIGSGAMRTSRHPGISYNVGIGASALGATISTANIGIGASAGLSNKNNFLYHSSLAIHRI